MASMADIVILHPILACVSRVLVLFARITSRLHLGTISSGFFRLSNHRSAAVDYPIRWRSRQPLDVTRKAERGRAAEAERRVVAALSQLWAGLL